MFRINIMVSLWWAEVDSKQIDLSQPLYFKGVQHSVPSLSQGILFTKIIMRVKFVTPHQLFCQDYSP